MRLGVHLIWEGVLALAAVALAVLVLSTGRAQLFGAVIGEAGPLGLVASGLALSLRTGTPNLAVAPIAAITSGVAAYLGGGYGWPPAVAITVALLLALVLGLILGVFVAAVSVPAWAASIVAAVICEALIFGLSWSVPRTWSADPALPPAAWFVIFAVVSVGGGVLWLIPKVRDTLSLSRDGDPARWDGLKAGLGALVGLTGASFLAGLGGIAQLMRLHVTVPSADWSTTGLALAAVLLGGVSLYGRRAGIAGTLLGVLIISMGRTLMTYHGIAAWLILLATGLLAALGLIVTRALESFR